ncbi:MAG TPA: HDOD domain-containing protein [Planctomycetota bacterium]|nr:HDOD domain-containing protein [Planctomycetota bacterium]
MELKRILFVDDENLILDGIRRSLFGLRKQWQMEFCDSPRRACELLREHDYDVVVSDMRMPGMDGSQFLGEVAKTRPNALRVILSGQSDMEATMRSAVIAHQFISKPCDGNSLDEVLSRTIRLHALLEDLELRSMVSGIKGLPGPPRTYQALATLLTNPDVDLDQVAGVVEQDIGLIAKTLQLVNSSFFGLARRVSSVRDAVSILGLNRIKSVVLCSEVYGSLDPRKLPAGFDPEVELRHAQQTALIARGLLQDKTQVEFTYLAAMLHDVGIWILAACEPETFSERYAEACRIGVSVDEIDHLDARLPHTRLGAYLLGIWNLPYAVVEAVAAHHRPSETGAKSFDALGALHVADCLANVLAARDPSEAERHMARLDREYLAAAGVANLVEGWLEQARQQTGLAA